GQGGVNAVAVGELEGCPVVVVGGGDGTVRVWDLGLGILVGEPFTGHQGGVYAWAVNAVAVAELEGRPVVVSGGSDGTVRVWDLALGIPAGEPLGTVRTASWPRPVLPAQRSESGAGQVSGR